MSTDASGTETGPGRDVRGGYPTSGSRDRECPTAAIRPPHRTAVRPALGPFGDGTRTAPSHRVRPAARPAQRRRPRWTARLGGSGDGGDAGGSGASGGGPGDPGSGSGAAPGPGPDRPWWRSVPRIAAIATALVAAVVLVVVLTRPDGGSKAGGEVFLQAAGDSGPDPFTESTARDSEPEPGTASPSVAPSASRTGTQATRGVDGAAPGLYGGTRKVASCDVEQQIKVLKAAPDKNRAFASVQDIEPSAVPGYLRGLTPVTLRMDTRVTNHGYRDGEANAYQAVLQAGTAVLVDDRGVPRVRCACGNPLLPPVAQEDPRRTGKAWPGYRASDVVVVEAGEEAGEGIRDGRPGERRLVRTAGRRHGRRRQEDGPAEGRLPLPARIRPSVPLVVRGHSVGVLAGGPGVAARRRSGDLRTAAAGGPGDLGAAARRPGDRTRAGDPARLAVGPAAARAELPGPAGSRTGGGPAGARALS